MRQIDAGCMLCWLFELMDGSALLFVVVRYDLLWFGTNLEVIRYDL